MFKRLTVALALFASLSFALAAKSVAPDWAAEFYPTDAQIKSACHDGYLDSTKAISWTRPVVMTADALVASMAAKSWTPHVGVTFDADFDQAYMITYQFPLGGAFNECRAQGRKLEPEIVAAVPYSIISVGGLATDLASASKWAAAIQVSDASGAEIARLIPDSSAVALGDLALWEKDCAKDPCAWKGRDVFLFASGDAAFKAAILAGGTPRLLLLRGRGLENIAFPTNFK